MTRIDGIAHLTNLTVFHVISIDTKSLVLRSNLIHKMQNMDTLVNLEVLELYDNKIHEIKHFSHLVNLRLLFCFSLIPSVLDLSFNKIKEIPDLSPLQRLEELFPLSPTFPPLATSPATTSKT